MLVKAADAEAAPRDLILLALVFIMDRFGRAGIVGALLWLEVRLGSSVGVLRVDVIGSACQERCKWIDGRHSKMSAIQLIEANPLLSAL